ncbi:hypothetical protein T440DRAFT_270641 [Plenodomus tracheiphilus IPT5]|uniref:Uncharacterized protein n=1 Tax=Plenodomus tracheiphilus IPT5 TaxID=1408161 RepID=A0A6A7BFN9_9PLEO|nr:hypothetical protein T440DRAFT_270641 [Plenodomus tracheiphilus IPT5]
MVTATESLAQLRADLHDNGHSLQYARLQEVKTQPLLEPDSISFAILFGYTIDELDDSERAVWVHFYPPSRPTSQGEVRFHSHEGPGKEHIKYDANNIVRATLRRAAAFTLPGTAHTSRSKLVALARYYFLEKLVEGNNKEDADKVALKGVPFSRTAWEELEAACHLWMDVPSETRRLSSQRPAEELDDASESGVIAQSQPTVEPSSLFSFESVGLDSLQAAVLGVGEDHSLAAHRIVQDQVVMTHAVTPGSTFDKLITLEDTKESLANEVRSINDRIATLAAERKKKEDEVDAVKKRRESLLQGMSAMEAYMLGEEVGEAKAGNRPKRQKSETTS